MCLTIIVKHIHAIEIDILLLTTVQMQEVYTEILIMGSGPAGLSAAIYAARAGLKPIVIEGMQPGGQLTITTEVENYPGFAEPIQGPWLMEQMRQQAQRYNTIITEDHITAFEFHQNQKVAISKNTRYIADAVIIATGAQAKWLGLDSETKFRGHGVSGCATCDGYFFKNKVVAVIGGGNTAAEEALFLSNHASKVYIIVRKDSLKAEMILRDRIAKNAKVHIVNNSVTEEILGETTPQKFVSGIKIKNLVSNQVSDLSLDGVFVAIGHSPNTEIFAHCLDMDQGYIKTTHGTTCTSLAGVFAAGDVQDRIYRQAVTAAGTGCMAALDAQKYLEHRAHNT